MTSRMHVVCVTMAALALMIADVAASRAAVRSCNAEPWRCRYSSDGRQYFHPAGSGTSVSTATLSTGAGAASNGHGWGCGATDGTARGRSWGFPNRTAASYRALSECTKRSAHASCRIVSCSAAVHSYDEAQVAWFADR
jgi:hypothetical protein